MVKIYTLILCLFLSINVCSQIVKQGEQFKNVEIVDEHVVFLKEIPRLKQYTLEESYTSIKKWAKDNYDQDPFVSSVRYDKNSGIIAKSRIELLLPANSKGIREKMVMRYRVNAFLIDTKCILEITDISYLYQNEKGDKLLPKLLRAEDFITNQQIEIIDNLQELRLNTRKSTLYFLNELATGFENQLDN